MIPVHKIRTPGWINVVGRINIKPAIRPDVGGGIGRVNAGDERIGRMSRHGHGNHGKNNPSLEKTAVSFA